jgi:hypothetical protein
VATIQHERVTREELLARLDELTQEKLGFTAEEFIERYKGGTLDLTSASMSNLAVLARLVIAAEKQV